MTYLCCIKEFRDFSFNTDIYYVYRYYNTDDKSYSELRYLIPCANVSENGNGIGFDTNDIIVNTSFNGKDFIYFGIEEYIDKHGKVTHLGVVDLGTYNLIVLPIDYLIRNSKPYNKSVVLNYSFDSNSLVKNTDVVVERKSTEEYLTKDIYTYDTSSSMPVEELRILLKYRGMNVGALCITQRDNTIDSEILIDEFWYKDSSILRLTYHSDLLDNLSYFSGNLYLATTKISDNVSELSIDIRENLFKSYDNYINDLLPTVIFNKRNNECYMKNSLLVNLITKAQEDISLFGKRYYDLLKLICFKNNIRYFSEGFREVLKPCINNIDAFIHFSLCQLQMSNSSLNEIDPVILWSNSQLSSLNSRWLSIK